VAELTEFARLLVGHGIEPVLLDREQTQALVHSPTYLASRYDADGVALVHPAKLAWGLRQACLDLGVRIYEYTEVTKITSDGAGLALRCPFGSIRGRQVALATNAFTNLLRRLGNYIVPVYDYVLVTEPLSPDQQDAVGWKGRQGSAFASKTSHAAWLKEIGIEAFARGRLMMLSLRRDGVAIAVKLNVLVDAGGYTFKIAYDERLERFSPGLLLELENIRRVHERANVAWMDSLAAPGHPLTERVWSGKAAFASMLIAPGRLVGRVLLAARPLLRLARQVAGVASARRGER
jgi:glycine/D-amino acid oxidase-like deaminating enzyme